MVNRIYNSTNNALKIPALSFVMFILSNILTELPTLLRKTKTNKKKSLGQKCWRTIQLPCVFSDQTPQPRPRVFYWFTKARFANSQVKANLDKGNVKQNEPLAEETTSLSFHFSINWFDILFVFGLTADEAEKCNS